VGPSDIVSCTVQNRETPSDITVDKEWVINGEDLSHAERPAGWDAELTLTGPGSQSGTSQAWGETRTGYSAGDTVTIAESVSGLPPGCEVVGHVTRANGDAIAADLPYEADLGLGSNTFTVTNTVECVQSLTLYKEVSGGDAAASEWTLTATGPDDTVALSGNDQGDGVTAQVAAGVSYRLSESGGPAEYVAAGKWRCVTGGGEAEEVDGTITVPLGVDVECTITNVTAALTLLKVIEGADSTLTPDQWALTATPKDGVDGLEARTVTGSDAADAANTVSIRPNHPYDLSEAVSDESINPLAYRLVAVQRWDGNDWVDITDTTVTIAAGGHETYRFVNAPIPAMDLPLTGGTGPATYIAAGAGVFGLALAIALGHTWRSRRDELLTN